MSEEDIKLHFITPAIQQKGWGSDISMEKICRFTDGKFNINGNVAQRETSKRVDYLLSYKDNPIAIVEAKDNNHLVSAGMQQAIEYAKIINVPFAYSSNGDAFQEHDFLTGKETERSLNDFPAQEELYKRFMQESNNGNGLSDKEKRLYLQPWYTFQDTFAPRYYQRLAVDKTLQAIAKGEKRLLLVMATGTGKTYTAFQIVWRLLKAKVVKKVLYLVDRNILADQSIEQDFKPLKNVTHKVNYQRDHNDSGANAYQIYFALYQQLLSEDNKPNYKELFDKDFFDLVIVDECHRGSAKADSVWHEILQYFDSAIQLGMTATPRETKYQSSVTYFGSPVYTYDLNQGIEDGFLAPFRVLRVKTNVGDNWRPCKGQKDIHGNLIEDREYNNTDYDYNIILQDRIDEVACEITRYLRSTDLMSKTIVFCANEAHAERMRVALTNYNSDICAKHSDYVVRITGSDDYGRGKLNEFISVNSEYPVIATTSKLLSTGVDCKMVKLIVIDQNINSLIEFKQIIGRGTRIREDKGKTNFTIMDFRNASRLFADANWAIEIPEKDSEYPTPPTPPPPIGPDGPTPPPPPPPPIKPIVDKNGCDVRILQTEVCLYDNEGKLLRTINIIDYTKETILDEYPDLSTFINHWNEVDKKEEITELFLARGIDLQKLKEQENKTNLDDFDFICYLAYNKKPLTRTERVREVKKRDIFSKYSEQAQEVLNILLDKYATIGISELESKNILKIDPLNKIGTPATIIRRFGNRETYEQAIEELKRTIYSIA